MTQLTFIPNGWLRRIWLRKVAHWLYLANANTGHFYKHEFYRLKDRILRRFALPEDEVDLQHIVKHCYGCDGTGIYQPTQDNCWRCGGTGVYEEFWVRLSRWRFGGHLFHLPSGRIRGEKPEGLQVNIEGLIEHEKVDHRDVREALLWLTLIYDRGLFWCVFHHSSGYANPGFRLLSQLQRMNYHVHGVYIRWKRHHYRPCAPCADCGKRTWHWWRRSRVDHWFYGYSCRSCLKRHAETYEKYGEVPF